MVERKKVQIYNTHARITGVDLDDLHKRLVTTLHALPGVPFVAMVRRAMRYVVHVVREDGIQAQMKMMVLADDTDETGKSWWLNVVPCRAPAHQSSGTSRHAVYGVYATMLAQPDIQPHVDAHAIHPEYTPLYLHEQHMTPSHAASISKACEVLPPPPRDDAGDPLDVVRAVITGTYYPMLFSPLKAWALTQLLQLPGDARAAAHVPQMVHAYIHQQLQRQECTLTELYCASKLSEPNSTWVHHVLSIARTSVCQSCAANGWEPVSLPVVQPCTYAASYRCLRCESPVFHASPVLVTPSVRI